MVTVWNLPLVLMGITPHWSIRGGRMGELWDIHDYSEGHFLKNVDIGHMFRPHTVL